MKKVLISLITFNSEKETLACLTSLEQIDKDGISLEIVVVDNASKIHFELPKKHESLPIKIMRVEKNIGFSGGHNMSLRYALEHDIDYVVLLNNDTVVEKNFLKGLLKAAEENDAGLVSPKIYFSNGSEFHKDRYKKEELGKVIWYAGGTMDWNNIIGKHRGVDEVDRGQYQNIESICFATGCCMLIKKDVVEKVGILDERYFLYYEDADYSERVKNAGFSIYYTPESIIWHENAGSAGGSGSILQDYFISRNRLLFGLQYAPYRSRIALLRESFQLLVNGRKWQKNGVIDFYLRKFGRGTFEI